MALTTPDNLPYPTDYADPADAPAALEDLALATQNALNNRATVYVQTAAPTAPRVGDIWCPI
jgi:hypothetical protein